jgi:peptidoglycan/xylan/chitin deacetylase (PgdA/CDA1 family)
VIAASGPKPLVLPSPLPHRELTVPILMYHRVGVEPGGEPAITRALTVAPHVFDAQMRWLRTAGFHAITAAQLYAALEQGARLPPRPVMITFDDGYRDVLWNASPELERLHMPAVELVITARVSDGDPSFLTWPQLELLEQRGFTIGSHTVHHLELTLLPPREALAELVLSRRTIERHLGRPVQLFAYPAGRVDAEVLRLVRQAGYVLAFTTVPGDVQHANEPFLLQRFEVLDSTGVAGLRALLGSPR